MLKSKYTHTGSRIALAGLFLIGLHGQAVAQEAPEADADGDVIIVTAQGREQSLQDVPVAVSVVSGESLLEQNITSLQDLSSRVGNVKITVGSLVNSINVRGVGSGENAGFEQAVATFADGAYRSRSKSTFAALFDVERVELLRGPQTTFFGANASAGALSITTRRPDGDFEYNASALYGFSDGEYDFQGGVSLPVTDTLSVRAAGRISGMEGYVDIEPRETGPNENNQQGRLSLHWEPSSSWTTDLRVDLARTRSQDAFPFQLINCPAVGFPANSPSCNGYLAADPDLDDEADFHSDGDPSTFLEFDFFEVAMTNALDVGFGTIRSISAYSDMTVDARVSLVPVPYGAIVPGVFPFPVESSETYEFYSQEVRLESETGGFLEYMIGAYYSHGELGYGGPASFNFLPLDFITESAFNVDWPNFAAGRVMSGIPRLDQTENMYSAFASATLHPTETIRVNLGGRYTRVDKEGHRSLTWGTTVDGVPSTFVPFSNATQLATVGVDGMGQPIRVPFTRTQAICIILGCNTGDFATTTRSDDKFMPSIGIQFDASDDVMLYGTFSKAFKAGGFSSTASAVSFGPEQADAYEFGIKSRLLDDDLTLNVAVFRMDYSGLQETTFDANLSSSITNVAGARSQGIEVGAAWRFNEYITLNADVAYLDATYNDYTNGECTKRQIANLPPRTPCVQNLNGASRAYAPDWSGSVGFDINIPIGDYVFSLNPSVNFSSSYFMTATADPLFQQDSYQKYDLRLAYGPADGPWELALIGRNLSNTVTTSYRLGVPGADGSVTSLVERGRSVGIQFVIHN